MSEAAVRSAADWIGKLLVEEGKYLWGAEGKIEELRNELLWMQCFLRDAETIQYKDDIVRMWLFQIKEYVSEAEDIIDSFIIEVALVRKRTGLMNSLKRYSCFPRELVALHQAASRIDDLNTKISMLSPKLKSYGLQTSYGVKTYRSREAHTELVQQSLKYRHLENDKIIGLEENAKEIIDALKKPEQERRAVAIYGMGGLGKTTLATKVFHHDEIKQAFICRAWAYISQQFQLQNVLRVILSQLTLKSIEMFSRKDVQELVAELQDFVVKNRCLVVLDDVWNQRDWDIMKAAFTTNGEELCSKVLLTTRKIEVAKHVDEHASPKPDPLKSNESWKLLLKFLGWPETDGIESSEIITSRSNEDEKVTANSDGRCDVPQMVVLGKEMLDRCNGIPLAIIVLGGILRKKETLEEWHSVHKNITSYLRRGHDHGRSCLEVLLQSYNDLSYHLKPCFLHLSNFPEDYEIRTEKLYWMWIAEGFITWSPDRIASTESLEDVANDYLSDLAQVGMVEVMEKTSNGRIKSIRMHDLMRDVCLQKAMADNFLNIIDHQVCSDRPLSISSYFAHKRLLRMAIYLPEGVNNFIPESLSSKAHKYLRSLLFITIHGAEKDQTSSTTVSSKLMRFFRALLPIAGHGAVQNKYQEWMKLICNDFQWLRVLDVEGFSLEGRLTTQIKNLKHLRYLSLKGTNVSEIPSSVGNLRLLEILDLRVSFAGSLVVIPNSLWKLDQLRHLLLPTIAYEIQKSKTLQLDTLSFLETLKNLEAGISRLEDLLKLQNLRKLSVKGTISGLESLKCILKSPALRSGGLRFCSLGIEGNLISEDKGIFSGCDCIRRLKIVQKVSVPVKHVAFPLFLKALHLESCEFEDDPMEVLGELGYLKDLFLGVDSFVGTKISCKPKAFRLLSRLTLRGLVKLEVWTMGEGSMPKLSVLRIWNCGKLQSIPSVLPSTVHVTCSPCVSGIDKHGTCICYSATSFFGKELIVGLGNDVNILSKKLLDDEYQRIVLVGAAGIGKVTLATELYLHPDIRRNFHARAWSCLPSGYTHVPRQTLRGILRELAPNTSSVVVSQKTSAELNADIEQVMLQKKCLIILTLLGDDPANLNLSFGSRCFESGSKLLLTYNQVLNTESDKQFLHQLHPLGDEHGRSLFQEISADSLQGDDALTKENMGKEMVQHCAGHPLSIRMLAGMMATKETLIEWETSTHKVLGVMNPVNDQPLPNIFSLCYQDLPFHLRPCLLYLANFPEHIEISTEKLFRMWIGAGFVRLRDDEIQTEEFLENIAESYLSELVLRGFVKVWMRGPSGRIKTCRLRFALKDLCLKTASEEHFLTVIDGSTPPASVSNTDLIAHHFAVHLNQDVNIVVPASPSSRVCSLLYFRNHTDPVREETWDCFITICINFQSLRVLDLEGMSTARGKLPREVENLKHLRYLSLKGTCVSELPLYLEKLSKIEALDLRVLGPIVIPDVLWKLKFLRHLYLPDFIAPQTRKLKLHELDNLQTLANIHTDKVHLNHVPALRLLKKISIRKIHSVNELDDMVKSLSPSLDLTINSDIINGNQTILSNLQNMVKVRIKGRISLSLEPQMFPLCLKDLTLKHTKLEQDPIPVLEKLLHLRRLFFDHESFIGKKMTFSGIFRPTHLGFRLLSNLEELDYPEGHLRHLESLEIKNCWRLKGKLKLRRKGDFD